MTKHILILNTGGTLSSKKSERGLVPELGKDDILKDLEWVARDCRIDYEEMYSLDSANIMPEDWKQIALRIGDVYNDYDGIVIIHGTDTMAYTASMLTWMLCNIPIPVVLTGSQLSIMDPVADAMENCRLAIHMAAAGHPGVFVAFNRKIILGCRASKVRTMSFDAFESINYPYIATVDSRGLRVAEDKIPPIGGKFRVNVNYSDQVFLLKLFPGLRPDIFEALYEMGYQGVVIEAFGLGGLPSRERDLIQAIAAVIEKGMLVLVGTQCRYDGSDMSVYETGRRGLACGVLQMREMTTEAAVTKLMWALGQTTDRNRIEEILSSRRP